MKINWEKGLQTIRRVKRLLQAAGTGLQKRKVPLKFSGTALKQLKTPFRFVGVKLFGTYFISILIFVFAVGIISYEISSSVVQKKVAEAAEQTITQANKNLSLMFNAYEDLTMQLNLDKDVQNKLIEIGNIGDKKSYQALNLFGQLADRLDVFGLANNKLQSIQLFLPDGQPVRTSDTLGMTPEETVKQEWFKQIISQNGSAIWMDTKASGYFGKTPSFAVGRTVKNPYTGEPLGVVVVEIKEESVASEMRDIRVGESSDIRMVNAEQTVVHAGKPEEVGQPAKAGLSQSDLEQDAGSMNRDGQLIVYAKSKVPGWVLVGEAPVKDLVRDAKRIFDWTLVIALIAMLFALVIGYYVAKMVGGPLKKLQGLMQRGAQGNLSVRAGFTSKDEIGQLGRSFDGMMEEIATLVRQTGHSAQEVLLTAEELSHVAKSTANSAKEIASATDDISKGAGGLAAESEKGNEMTRQIGARTSDVLNASKSMEDAAQDIHRSGEQGTRHMSELMGKTGLTEEKTHAMVDKVEQLKESMKSIRQILKLLQDLTKQTNILSLNAAIEAARAGAAGKGFMVIADDIRHLAEQSNRSIAHVGRIADQIRDQIDEAVTASAEAYPLFREQIASAKDADTIFGEVRQHMDSFITHLASVKEAFGGLSQTQHLLSDVMGNVSAVAEQSSATSQEVAALSSEQMNASDGLVSLSDKLERLSVSLKDSLGKFQMNG